MDDKSKEKVESAISEAMGKFLKEQMGEHVETIIVRVLENTIIVRFKGVLPPAERHMARDGEGMKLIKELKMKLAKKAQPLLETLIKNLTRAEVVDIHSSINPGTGERIEIFTLSKDLEKTNSV